MHFSRILLFVLPGLAYCSLAQVQGSSLARRDTLTDPAHTADAGPVLLPRVEEKKKKPSLLQKTKNKLNIGSSKPKKGSTSSDQGTVAGKAGTDSQANMQADTGTKKTGETSSTGAAKDGADYVIRIDGDDAEIKLFLEALESLKTKKIIDVEGAGDLSYHKDVGFASYFTTIDTKQIKLIKSTIAEQAKVKATAVRVFADSALQETFGESDKVDNGGKVDQVGGIDEPLGGSSAENSEGSDTAGTQGAAGKEAATEEGSSEEPASEEGNSEEVSSEGPTTEEKGKGRAVEERMVDADDEHSKHRSIFKRRPGIPTLNLIQRTGAYDHLKMVSQGPKSFQAALDAARAARVQLPDGFELPPAYYHDQEAGKGIYIFVVDTGFYQETTEFNFKPSAWKAGVDYYVVPSRIMKEAKSLKDNKPFPNLDKLTETEEHGTCVASVAAGKRVGVAPKATIIPVKIKNKGSVRAASLDDAFGWILGVINERKLQGKAIINMSMGLTPSTKAGHEQFGIEREAFESHLERFWAQDIVFVTACGNDGELRTTMAETIPQNIGTTKNQLITMGGIEKDGRKWVGTTPEGPGANGGSMTATLSPRVACASIKDPDGIISALGTSFAAGQASGLIAAFMSAPNWEYKRRGQDYQPGQLPALVKSKWIAEPDGAGYKIGLGFGGVKNPWRVDNLSEGQTLDLFIGIYNIDKIGKDNKRKRDLGITDAAANSIKKRTSKMQALASRGVTMPHNDKHAAHMRGHQHQHLHHLGHSRPQQVW